MTNKIKKPELILDNKFTFNGFEITLKEVLKNKLTENERSLISKELKELYFIESEKDREKITDFIETLLPYFKQR